MWAFATAAEAHVSVGIGIGIPIAPAYPVYAAPPPVYYAPPPPVYAPPPVVVVGGGYGYGGYGYYGRPYYHHGYYGHGYYGHGRPRLLSPLGRLTAALTLLSAAGLLDRFAFAAQRWLDRRVAPLAFQAAFQGIPRRTFQSMAKLGEWCLRHRSGESRRCKRFPLPLSTMSLDAAARLEGVAHRTPVLTSSTPMNAPARRCSSSARIFSAWARSNFAAPITRSRTSTAAQREAGVLTYSSGNHAQAIALSARLAGIRATIIMPHDAPAAKVAATKGYGGEVIIYDRYKENREEIGLRLAKERGMTLIPPYDHPHVIAGQGTAVKELIEETGRWICCSCASAAAGCSAAVRLSAAALSPECTRDRRRTGSRQRRPAVARARRDRAYRRAAYHRRRCGRHASRSTTRSPIIQQLVETDRNRHAMRN